MSGVFDPQGTLERLHRDYRQRTEAIRDDLARPHDTDATERAGERQNDEVLQALLAEAEAGMRQVERARQRLAEGRYGLCRRCGQPIEPARLAALPVAELCLHCAGLEH
ncbi:TraR/DksA family transcriptional regulator [Azotobacter chroococcum]|jgi:DnaK suppressor protein|uniref:TraR/DksA family transcriptional regulator n=1 Tax=Azotobacter chroococcum TaxID=353 RepID=A0A4R1PPA5_9GAMM|nr:TraR/DksA C4-type zinc finger protein [Azotobacter chroococcum]TBV90786.1 TraR/DksA family transcriptional regulator [Azotobacter chroococcum]TCL32261.1 TraR/DksA family transcriptional regulator [Azotobacter chroococcum]